MTWSDVANSYGITQQDINEYTRRGWSPDLVMENMQKYGGPAKSAASKQGPQNAFGIRQVSSGDGYVTLQNAQGKQISVDNAGNYFTIDAAGNHTPISDIQAQGMGFQSANPGTQALT